MIQKFLIALLFLLPYSTQAQDIPPKPEPARFVNDYVHILSADQQADIEHKLKVFEDSTSNQIVVVVVSSTKGYDPFEYALALGRKWGVGSKEFNNGIVLLIAKEDHKVFIATGYGLEGVLPDATCKQIVENDIIPYFKTNDYYRGIVNGVDDIMAAIKGEYKSQHKKSGSSGKSIFAWIFIIIFILVGFLAKSRGGRRWGGTYYGGGYGRGWTSSSGGNSSSFGGGSFGGGGAGGSW